MFCFAQGNSAVPTMILLPLAVACAMSADLEARVGALEALVRQQASRIADLERVAPSSFSVLHYNVLARQYGSNCQPWFLYGAEPPVSADERAHMFDRFYERSDDGSYANAGWPRWAVSTLSPERIAAIEQARRGPRTRAHPCR